MVDLGGAAVAGEGDIVDQVVLVPVEKQAGREADQILPELALEPGRSGNDDRQQQGQQVNQQTPIVGQ